MSWEPRYYVLDDERRLVQVKDVIEWGRWFNGKNRHVGDDHFGEDVRVSTVFLGLDHRYDNKGPPLVFETMVFGPYGGGEQYRYSTWDDAEAGHKATVKRVRAMMDAMVKDKEPRGCRTS